MNETLEPPELTALDPRVQEEINAVRDRMKDALRRLDYLESLLEVDAR